MVVLLGYIIESARRCGAPDSWLLKPGEVPVGSPIR
jgi:hypothetical protein